MKQADGHLGTIQLQLHELANYMKTLNSMIIVMEIDAKHEKAELFNKEDIGPMLTWKWSQKH